VDFAFSGQKWWLRWSGKARSTQVDVSIRAVYDEDVIAKGKDRKGSLLEGEQIYGAWAYLTHEVAYLGFECGEAFVYGVGDVP